MIDLKSKKAQNILVGVLSLALITTFSVEAMQSNNELVAVKERPPIKNSLKDYIVEETAVLDEIENIKEEVTEYKLETPEDSFQEYIPVEPSYDDDNSDLETPNDSNNNIPPATDPDNTDNNEATPAPPVNEDNNTGSDNEGEDNTGDNNNQGGDEEGDTSEDGDNSSNEETVPPVTPPSDDSNEGGSDLTSPNQNDNDDENLEASLPH